MSQTRTPKPAKAPSVRPYREPEPAVKQKRVVRTVSERDGQNLLRKIQANGGRDTIVMMRDSERTPQEIAESLLQDDLIVVRSLNSYGSNKDRLTRLRVAVEQAPRYLLGLERPVIAGVKKQQRQKEAEAKRQEIASRKKNPKTREFTVPTVDEVRPKREDADVVHEELKKYLECNASLSAQVLNATSDDKAARALLHNAGRKFDDRIKKLLAVPAGYQILLARAASIIRSEVRKYDAVAEASTPPASESPEIPASQSVGERSLERYNEAMGLKGRTVTNATDDPEVQAREERFAAQNASLSRFMEAHPELT